MILETHIPKGDLACDIECCIFFKNYMPEHSIERVVPDGSINLIFELDDMPRHVYHNNSLEPKQRFERAWISGMHRGYISIQAQPDSSMFVIRFNPGGACPYLHQDVDTISDTVVDAVPIFGAGLLTLRTQLLAADSAESKFDVAQNWLLQRQNPQFAPDTVIRTALDKMRADPAFGGTSLTQLIEESGYSQRQFIRLFKKYVGLTPKYFQRVLRFNEILPKVQQKEALSWAQIGNECGFYDQAHFIKEFKHFSGFNPQEFIKDFDTHERINFFPLD